MCSKKYAYIAFAPDKTALNSNKKTPLLIINKDVYQQSFNAVSGDVSRWNHAIGTSN